jgi:hypothetical protein
MKVRVWNREKVANGIIDTTRQPHSILLQIRRTIQGLGNEPIHQLLPYAY